MTGLPAEGVDPIEDAALPDPYVCQRCHRLYPYLDLMGQPDCECGSESFFYVPNGAEAAHVIHRNLERLASGGSGEAPADRFTVERAPDGQPAIVEGEAPAELTREEQIAAATKLGADTSTLPYIPPDVYGAAVKSARAKLRAALRGPVGGEAGQET